MNVYDFDKTIYSGDSTVDFYLFCLGRHPGIIKMFPSQFAATVKYFAKNADKTGMKEGFFSFLTCVPNVEGEVNLFWSKNERKIKHWYLAQKRVDDVIISASPEFLLQPACERIGVSHLIASKVDVKTGKFLSVNCGGKEKVIRFQEEFPESTIEKFYSDSESDRPTAGLAMEAFFVNKDQVIKWK